MLKRIVILLLLWIVGSHAVELVTKSNLLGEGKSIRFYPKQGESFAVTKDLSQFAPDANYDIVMRNGQEIYFSNRNEREDIYIVFNEPLAKGDVVVLKVNRGVFAYTIRRIQELPPRVKKILQAAKQRGHTRKKKVEKRGEVLITTDTICFDNQGEIVECSSPRATINQKKSVTAPAANSQAVLEVKQQTKREKKESVRTSGYESEKRDLLPSFAEKIKAALTKIKALLSKTSKVEIDQNEQILKREKRTHVVEKAKPPKKLDKKKQTFQKPDIVATGQKSVQKRSAEIMRYMHAKSAPMPITQKVVTPHFRTLSMQEDYPGQRSPSKHIAATVATPEIKSSQKASVVQPPATQRVTTPGFYHKPQSAKVQHSSPLDRIDREFQPPKYQQSPRSALPSQSLKMAAPMIASKITAPATTLQQASLPRRGIPKAATKPEIHHAVVAGTATAPNSFSPTRLPVATSQIARDEGLVGVSRLGQTSPVSTPVTHPMMTQPAATPLPETTQASKPQIAEEEAPKDKIVITKIIEKKSPPPPTESMLSMSDRILGGGYSADQHVGKVSVSAYANRKPISAWVEVYQGKRRVKTFYSGAKKQVTLPEGTYLLKATYRTGTSKQKKHLGRIKLKSGGSIHKNVYFSIGTLNVKVTRKGKPIYAKVEIYPKGSNQRYAYTFTAPNSGIARLQLSAGRYRIVVKAYGVSKVLEHVGINGGRTKTVPVEF